MELEKVYEPQRFEPHWAQWWIDSGIFRATARPGHRVFSLVIPPPNITGVLHMGHMLEHTEIDVTVRWHRMRGDDTLWLPGTDHAGIATQMVVDRQLRAEGIDRFQLGREEFERRVWAWKERYGDTIKRQIIRMGASCDWSRERFTLDPGLSRAVREVFVSLYERGLIYRGEYMVNWCPSCMTAISDLEVSHQETAGSLWHLNYPVVGMPGGFLTVATTRPETMLGDTAVAVNAHDRRYTALHGRFVMLPLSNREIPIILDDLADPAFGTGVVKVTPAHDPNDFEAGKRHNLPRIQVIDERGRMTEAAGPYAGLDRFAARKRILADLEASGVLVKTEEHPLSIGRCDRCKTVVEPLISTQWFVKTKPLADKAIRAVETGRIRIVPENWTKTYNEWMYNIRDWCVSRQLWWGHRVPAWYCNHCAEIIVSREAPETCIRCGSTDLHQDTDVLDTWFSSGLWPFSTLGWPDNTPDLRTFYPTTLLITGFDILFFWVARMIMLGMEFMGDVPFHEVYIHGLVRDADRQKMSKTKGNTVDPLIVTEQYGTDAVRMALLTAAAPGTDIVFTPERMESARAFANKIWNAARFLFFHMDRSGVQPWTPEDPAAFVPEGHSLEDRWIFSRLNACAEQVNRAIEQHRYHEVAQSVWHYFWGDFCDWYLEMKKLRFQENSGLNSDWRNLLAGFEASLRLLHPVMPFLTEELWQRLGTGGKSIALASYPQYSRELSDPGAEQEMQILQDMVSLARNLRQEFNINPKLVLPGTLYSRGPAATLARAHADAVLKLANVNLQVREDYAPTNSPAVRSTPEFDLVLTLPESTGAADPARANKEAAQLRKVIANTERQLSDESFTAKAPENIVAAMRVKLDGYRTQLAKLEGAFTAQ
ncbi:MAG: valine--tRNA ligase [Acidobacteriota bacterium]|nr:valine--tRNA ligase [Acidobacteriota bacterium]